MLDVCSGSIVTELTEHCCNYETRMCVLISPITVEIASFAALVCICSHLRDAVSELSLTIKTSCLLRVV